MVRALRAVRVVGLKAGLYATLIAGMALFAFPYYYMFVGATRPHIEILSSPPTLLPGTHFLTNMRGLLETLPFMRNMWNSLFVATTATLLTLLFTSLAGFAFAKYRFPGRESLFLIMMATLMIPAHLGLIPSFILMKWLGWLGSFKPLIIPGVASAFGTFWMRQYIAGAVPDEILDAGTMDGCSPLDLYWRIVLPIIRPALSALGIFTFIFNWNNFIWPLIILKERSMFTVPVALRTLQGIHGFDFGIMFAGAAVATLPMLLVFLVASRQFIAGLTLGALRE